MRYFDNMDYVWGFEKGGREFQKPIPIKITYLTRYTTKSTWVQVGQMIF